MSYNHNHIQPFRFFNPNKMQPVTEASRRAFTPEPWNKVSGHKYASWGSGYQGGQVQ